MAIFGDLGKALGLGTAKQTLGAAAQGALRGAIIGQPFMGAAGGALTAGTQQGQATAVAVPQAPPAETAFSGETVAVQQPSIRAAPISFRPGVQQAIMRTPMPPARSQSTQAGLPAIVGGGLSVGRGVMGMLGIAGGAITVAPIIIDPLTGEEKKLRVTRRLKSQVKQAVEMFGVEFVAEQMGVDAQLDTLEGSFINAPLYLAVSHNSVCNSPALRSALALGMQELAQRNEAGRLLDKYRQLWAAPFRPATEAADIPVAE